MFTKEIFNIALCQCPGVIKLHEVVHCREGWVLILDHITDGTIWEEGICKNEIDVLHYSLQLAQVISHMQSKGVIHRDMKPTNILKNKNKSLFLIDFGWSESLCNLHHNPKEWPGTLEINPPEVLNCQGPYTEKIDNFALGMSILLFSTSRFVCRKKGTSLSVAANHVLQSMKKLRTRGSPGGLLDNHSLWDLFHKLTDPNPNSRASIDEFYNHKWVLKLMPRYIETYGTNYVWQPSLKFLLIRTFLVPPKFINFQDWTHYDNNLNLSSSTDICKDS